jgi:DUF1365 family protein
MDLDRFQVKENEAFWGQSRDRWLKSQFLRRDAIEQKSAASQRRTLIQFVTITQSNRQRQSEILKVTKRPIRV